MNFFKRAKTRYILHRHPIEQAVWHAVTENLNVLQGLSAVEKAHLRELSTLFLQEKTIIGVNLTITDNMRVTLAAHACLPVLHLGLSLLAGWSDILIYPSAFHVARDEKDADGIVHHQDRILSGEAWSRGPVILSWEDIEWDIKEGHHGHSVIIHEIAHKLDMLDGSCNGMPPLHVAMSIPDWTLTLSTAYQQLEQDLMKQHPTTVNAYAASSPAEFFAVFSEYFFSAPQVIHTHFSGVYEQLQLYYRQDPLSRRQSGV